MVVLSGFVALLFASGIVFWIVAPLSPGESHRDRLFLVLLASIVCAFMTVLGGSRALDLLMSEAWVDPDYLSWRTWQGIQSIRWEDIPDYYELELRDFSSGNARLERQPLEDKFRYARICLVETPAGECRFGQTWQNADRLQEIINERAVNARATRWGMLGARPELDWPKTFRYDTAASRFGIAALRLICYSAVVVFVIMCGPGLWRSAVAIASVMGWGWGVAFLICSSCAMLSQCGLVLILSPGFGELWRRRTLSITLSKTGIRYHDKTRTVQSDWDEITRLTTITRKCNVETQQGDFSFDQFIGHFQALKTGVEAMTRDTVPGGWELDAKDRIDQDALRPGTGDSRFYSYRTRTNRAMLIFSLLMCGLMTESIIRAFFTKSVSGGLASVVTFVFMGICCAGGMLFTLSGWACYFAAGVRTDADGITQVTAFGSKRILWSSIQEVKATGEDVSSGVLLSDGRQRIRVPLLIADSKMLLTEIKQHTGRKDLS